MLTVSYANQSDSQVMDIYFHKSRKKSPVIVLIHGGAFMFGNQKMELIKPVIKMAVNKGYVVASVDYRKSNESKFPSSIFDIKSSVLYLKSHSKEYGIDSNKIILWGESAGGYLALMAALTPTVSKFEKNMVQPLILPNIVSAMVLFYPPVEFYTMKKEYESWGDSVHGDGKFESIYLGVDNIYLHKDYCDRAYWETYKGELPTDFKLSTWIQTGDENDIKVPFTQSKNLSDRLSSIQGIDISYEQIINAGHEDTAFYTEENLSKIFIWLKNVLC